MQTDPFSGLTFLFFRWVKGTILEITLLHILSEMFNKTTLLHEIPFYFIIFGKTEGSTLKFFFRFIILIKIRKNLRVLPCILKSEKKMISSSKIDFLNNLDTT